MELDWLPQGNTETIDKYLKTIPTSLLPIKGSQAAQDRKQLLQKQIPIHDIDPLLCHELTKDEMNQMNDYIAHVKNSSVGVGQLVCIANLLKGELHQPNNFIHGIPTSELVNLEEFHQSASLPSHLHQLDLNNESKTKNDFIHLQPNNGLNVENIRNPIKGDLMRDLNYGHYAREENQYNANVQCSQNLVKNVKDLMYSTFDNNVPLNNNFGQPEEQVLLPNQVPIGAIQDIVYKENEHVSATNNTPHEMTQASTSSDQRCHYCKKLFKTDEFAIILERSAALYHADCFKCYGCNQILADNMYFYDKESDNVYCGRDYAKIRGIPRCSACDELIFTKEYCLAQDATFHLKHFSCFYCDKQLAGENYLIEDSNPLCLPCFETQKADKCMTCCEIIKPDQQGLTIKDRHFHANENCFACCVCKMCLFEKKLLFRNDKLYCSYDCFNDK